MFSNTDKLKEKEISNGTLLLKCTKAECSKMAVLTFRTDVCDCFPCTNAAQSLLGVLSMSGKLQH